MESLILCSSCLYFDKICFSNEKVFILPLKRELFWQICDIVCSFSAGEGMGDMYAFATYT